MFPPQETIRKIPNCSNVKHIIYKLQELKTENANQFIHLTYKYTRPCSPKIENTAKKIDHQSQELDNNITGKIYYKAKES
jgi:hypothetical protein